MGRTTSSRSETTHNAYDVIVVGAGGAGLAAACAAAEQGARVLVLEKLPALLGTTSYSVGSFAAAETRIQSVAGIKDWASDFEEDMALATPQTADTSRLRAMLARESGPTLNWLERLGVVFVGPYPEPPNRVPRMHNAVPAGHIYLQVLSRHARRLGVELRFGVAVTELLIVKSRVTGVRIQPDAGLTARAVVLAAGDYSASKSMRHAHLTSNAASALPINPNSTGDGHQLALQAGAALKRLDGVFGPQLRFAAPIQSSWISKLPSWRWVHKIGALILTKAPPSVLAELAKPLLVAHMSPAEGLVRAGAVIVDKTGQRVGSDDDTVPALAADLAMRPGATGYLIGDESIAQRFSKFPDFISTAPGIAFAYFKDYERGRPDLVHWAADAAALATRLEMQTSALGSATTHLSGRLFALGPCNAMLTVTEGGASIDPKCQVLDRLGVAIPGLFAAGGNGQSGLMLKGHGLHLAWAMTSGRVAGLHAAQIREPNPAA
jgi:fumarate reductase flavoprotein subunit